MAEVDREAIMLALLEAMEEGGKTISDADQMIVKEMLGGGNLREAGKTISDADRMMIKEMNPDKRYMMRGRSNSLSDAERKRVSQMEGRAVESGNNEARRRNVTMPRPKQRTSGMMIGGKVKKYKGGGAVMAGRGGKFKGTS